MVGVQIRTDEPLLPKQATWALATVPASFSALAKAVDMILAGRMIDAEEAERMGMARFIPAERLIEEAVGAAHHIASLSRPAVYLAKGCVNRADETSLAEGIHLERCMFHAAFSTEGQKEGMDRFVEKAADLFQPLGLNRFDWCK